MRTQIISHAAITATKIACLCFGLTLAAPASASTSWYDADFTRCPDTPTVDLVCCLNDHTVRLERQLHRIYLTIPAAQKHPEMRKRLQAAQRLWTLYRDANCAFYGSGEGTISLIHGAECRRALTKSRLDELRRLP